MLNLIKRVLLYIFHFYLNSLISLKNRAKVSFILEIISFLD